MRETKFRAWDKVHEEMIEWEKYKDELVSQDFTDNNLVIMQSTGLKDKDFVEIYEGDVVRVMDSTFAIVKYSDDRGAYYLDCGKRIGDIGLVCQYDTIKRVGNVYETPKLLESEEERNHKEG